MDKVVLLTELRALAERPPDFSTYTPTSHIHLDWLAKAEALLSRWDAMKAVPFVVAVQFLEAESGRAAQVGTLTRVLYLAIADLELDIPPSPQQVFGPGAVYDFLKSLRDVLGSASSSLLIVDPYLDDQIFDAYLSSISAQIQVRLLTQKYAQSLKASLAKFRAQNRLDVEIRHSSSLHDRVVCVDDRSCWVLGQSIKDAAKTKPTYIAPLSADAAEPKIAFYRALWKAATPL
jgi:hypothetical protein